MTKQMLSFLKEDKGQGMVEYGLIIALIAIAVIAAISFLGGELKGLFERIGDTLKGSNGVNLDPTKRS